MNTGPSPHLAWSELACHDPAQTPYPAEWRKTRANVLADMFEGVRWFLGSHPLIVLSGYRTPEWNRRVGGARRSQHVEGRAVDIRRPRGMTATELFTQIRLYAKLDDTLAAIGLYTWGVHLDVRPRGPRLVVWNMVRRGTDVHDSV